MCAMESRARVGNPRYLAFCLTPSELGDRCLWSWKFFGQKTGTPPILENRHIQNRQQVRQYDHRYQKHYKNMFLLVNFKQKVLNSQWELGSQFFVGFQFLLNVSYFLIYVAPSPLFPLRALLEDHK